MSAMAVGSDSPPVAANTRSLHLQPAIEQIRDRVDRCPLCPNQWFRLQADVR